jgi:hypothetical protein
MALYVLSRILHSGVYISLRQSQGFGNRKSCDLPSHGLLCSLSYLACWRVRRCPGHFTCGMNILNADNSVETWKGTAGTVGDMQGMKLPGRVEGTGDCRWVSL